MVKSHSLAADCHVFPMVSFRVRYNLVVVRVRHSIQIEKVFNHLWERIIECEDFKRLQISSYFILSIFHQSFGLLR